MLRDAPGVGSEEPDVPVDEPVLPIDDEPDESMSRFPTPGVGLELESGLPMPGFGSFSAANAGAIENTAMAAPIAKRDFMAFLQPLFQANTQ